MNQQQKGYLKKRIEGIKMEKIRVLQNDCTVKGNTLKNEERVDLIYDGKVSLKDKDDVKYKNYGMYTIADLYEFSPFESKRKFDQKRYDEGRVTITNSANKLIDEAMLGDAEEAIAMIKEFEELSI